MKNLMMAFRSLFKKGRNNGIKILSLGVGLAMGLVLISKVMFEFTYDDFYPDKDRIYMINTIIHLENNADRDFTGVSGGVAPGMKREIPEVEVATRYAWFGQEVIFKTPDKRKYIGDVIYADTCFFDVLPLSVITGDVKDILARPSYGMISETIAKNMGGIETVMGQVVEFDSAPGKRITIGGVFKDMPENSHVKYDMILSMPTLGVFSWDGTENWYGNERYRGYVKLYPGVDPESLAPAIRRMQEKNQPLEEMQKAGVDITYTLLPLAEFHSGLPETKRMALLLSLLAFALIFTAIMNYILVVLSSLVARTKEMAVYKSYGATGKNIMNIMLLETAVHLVLALLLSVFLILLFRGKIQEILTVSVSALFTLRTMGILAVICLLVFLISGIIPSWLYARIPVSSAFRSFKESRRNWKMVSLFIQFIAAMFLVPLLVIIWKQYKLMVDDNPGYAYEKLLYCYTSGVQEEERLRAVEEISRLSFVQSVATATTLPIDWMSGNNVSFLDDDRELFNIADMYYADENYLPLMEIPVIAGTNFMPGLESEGNTQMIVSKSFADRLIRIGNLTNGVVGKSVNVSEHGVCTIIGVFPDIRLTSIANEDDRPAALFYRTTSQNRTMLIKLHQLKAEDILTVIRTLEQIMPNKEIDVLSYKLSMVGLYESSQLFRDSVMIGGMVTLLISLIGLIGYVKDEMNRRRSEIAVRRINGGTVADILVLFIKNIGFIAVPAILTGGLIAYLTGSKWLESFSVKITLAGYIFILCGLFVLVVIIGIVMLNGYKNASENPVNNLRSE